MQEWRRVTICLVIAGMVVARAHAAPAVQRVEDTLKPLPADAVELRGELGARIDLCTAKRVWGLPRGWEQFVKPFEAGTAPGSWIAEFWGKWFTSAALAYHYQPRDESLAVLRQSTGRIMAAQDAGGYIGTYTGDARFKMWDVWCRKYTMLGLLAYYDETGDKSALAALGRLADNLMANIGPGKQPLSIGAMGGAAGATILEPIVLLYLRTGEVKYLEYAGWLADFIRPGLAGQIKSQTLGGHAYVNMSMCEGMLELYRATGDPRYRDLAMDYYKVIQDTEILVVGSGSDGENWCGKRFRGGSAVLAQDKSSFSLSIELCATATWIKLNYQLLRLTGRPQFADAIERTTYNMLLRSMDRSTGQIGYHVPLCATNHSWNGDTWGTDVGCCSANGPRAVMLLPRLAVMSGEAGPVVNLYAGGHAVVPLPQSNRVRLVQTTEYPLEDTVMIAVQPERPAEFTIQLRIPAWSTATAVTVNDVAPEAKPTPGTYLSLRRLWQPNDTIRLKLDLRGKIVPAPSGSGAQALMRGPLVLGLQRAQPLFGARSLQFQADPDGIVGVKRLPAPAGQWTSFSVPCVLCNGKKIELPMSDYATAGDVRLWFQKPVIFNEPRQDYAYGLTATASSSDEWPPRWSLDNLTGGKMAKGRPPSGYTSIGFKSPVVNEWLELAFCKPVSVNRIVLYPRTDALAADKATPDFPVDFTLSYKATEDAASYTAIRTYTNYPNPKGQSQALTFPTVQASCLRLAVTRLGLPPVAEPNVYRLQLEEVEIGDSNGKQ